MGFTTHFMNGAPQEIKVKLMKVDNLISTKKTQLKENSTERKFNREFCRNGP